MKKKLLIFKLFALVAALSCAIGMQAAEAYACHTSSNTTLTFYYDNLRSSRTGTTYDENHVDAAYARVPAQGAARRLF